MLRKEYDLVVLGGGPTGLTAALGASAMGRSCLIVDATPKKQVQFTGPTGLFSKALRDTAKKVDVAVLNRMGVRNTAVWRQVQDMTGDILKASGLSNLKAVQLNRIPHLRGSATILDANTVRVQYQDTARSIEIKGKNLLIATGSRPYRLPTFPYDEQRVFDSDTIKQLSFLPKTVAIVGAGIIAMEYAKIFATLDCKVTMIVRGKSLASALERIGVDGLVALQLQKDLCLNKVRIVFEAEVESVEKPSGSEDGSRPLIINLKNSKTGEAHRNGQIRAHILMTATGRSANINGLGLPEAGIETDKNGNVLVDGSLRTSVPTVYAAGDVLGAPSLASTGIEQAQASVRAMFGKDVAQEGTWRLPAEGFDPRSLTKDPLQYPIGIWTIPEMAFIGWTRKGAQAAGVGGEGGVGEGIAYYQDTIRGHVQDVQIGMLKLVFKRPCGTIIGVHILGEDACELIHYGTALAQSGKTVYSVLGTMFAAVTFHELFKRAALDAVTQLDEAKWLKIVKKIGVDGDDMVKVADLESGLNAVKMDADDVLEICNGLRCPGSPKVTRAQVMSQVSKYALPVGAD